MGSARPEGVLRTGSRPLLRRAPARSRWRASRPAAAADRGAGAGLLRGLPARGQGVGGQGSPRLVQSMNALMSWLMEPPVLAGAKLASSHPSAPNRLRVDVSASLSLSTH